MRGHSVVSALIVVNSRNVCVYRYFKDYLLSSSDPLRGSSGSRGKKAVRVNGK